MGKSLIVLLLVTTSVLCVDVSMHLYGVNLHRYLCLLLVVVDEWPLYWKLTEAGAQFQVSKLIVLNANGYMQT